MARRGGAALRLPEPGEARPQASVRLQSSLRFAEKLTATPTVAVPGAGPHERGAVRQDLPAPEKAREAGKVPNVTRNAGNDATLHTHAARHQGG